MSAAVLERRTSSGLVLPGAVEGVRSYPVGPWDGRTRRTVMFDEGGTVCLEGGASPGRENLPVTLAEVDELARELRLGCGKTQHGWGGKLRALRHRGVPMASRQYYAETLAPLMTSDQASLVGTSEAAMWPVSPWSATVANQLQPGQVYRITAIGGITSAASTPGTLTITPRWGTTTGGTSLIASTASATLTTSKTSPWFMETMFVCRTIGTAGTALLAGEFSSDGTANGIGVATVVFGFNSAQATAATAIDTTTAQGFFFGATLGSASDSMWTRLVVLEALN